MPAKRSITVVGTTRQGLPDDEPLSVAVINELAAREGVDPTQLDPPLYEVVDPDSLDSLFRLGTNTDGQSVGTVSFRYGSYDVEVASDGTVSVRDTES
jgi:hypothetical protein